MLVYEISTVNLIKSSIYLLEHPVDLDVGAGLAIEDSFSFNRSPTNVHMNRLWKTLKNLFEARNPSVY